MVSIMCLKEKLFEISGAKTYRELGMFFNVPPRTIWSVANQKHPTSYSTAKKIVAKSAAFTIEELNAKPPMSNFERQKRYRAKNAELISKRARQKYKRKKRLSPTLQQIESHKRAKKKYRSKNRVELNIVKYKKITMREARIMAVKQGLKNINVPSGHFTL